MKQNQANCIMRIHFTLSNQYSQTCLFTTLFVVLTAFFCLSTSCVLKSDKTRVTTYSYTTAKAPEVNGWNPIGPGGGGTIFLPVISPHNKDVMMTLCDMSCSFLSKDGGRTWTTLYFNGTIDTYCFDPVDPDIIYVGSRQSGLWKTVNGGDHWHNVHPDFESAARVVRIAVDPADNRIVYVCTVNNAFHVSYDGGVTFEYNVFPAGSMPAGEYHGRYRVSGPGAGSSKDVTVMLHIDPESPADARVIYTFNRNVFEGGKIMTQSSINRIEKTGPGRRDYRITYSAPPVATNICGIDWVYDPDAPAGKKTTYYVTMASEAISTPAASEPSFPHQFQDPSNDLYDGSVWKTHDLCDPASYALIADNNLKALRDVFHAYNRHPEDHLSLTRFKAASNRVFFMEVNSFGRESTSGVYQYGYLRSTDAGQSWEWLVFLEEDELIYPDESRYPPSWLTYHYGFEYPGSAWGIATTKLPPDSNNPFGVRIVMVDQGQIYISDNGGTNWRHGHTRTTTGDDGYVYGATNGIQVTSTYDISFDPFDANHIIISKTDVGQLVSYDGGKNWRPNENGLMPEPYGWRQFNKFKKDNPAYVRYWTNTCYKTVFDPAVKGKVWSVWSRHHDMPRPPMARSERIDPGCIAVSVDGGRKWNIQAGYLIPEEKSGVPELNTVFTDFIIDLNSSPKCRTLYAAVMGQGIYKSVDDGATWKQKVNGIEPLSGIPQSHIDDGMLYRAWKLMMTPDGALYVTMNKSTDASPGMLYVSRDGAETWEKLTTPGNAPFVWGMDYDWSDPMYKTLYAAAEHTGNNPVGGIYKSVDGGHNWIPIHNDDAPAFNSRGILVDHIHPKTVYASSNNGHLMQSNDAGETWFDLDLKVRWHECLVQNPHQTDRLYVVTHGIGVWYGNVIAGNRPPAPEKSPRTYPDFKLATTFAKLRLGTLEANLKAIEQLIDETVEGCKQEDGKGPDMILLSESVFSRGNGKGQQFDKTDGLLMQAMANKARQHNCYIAYNMYEDRTSDGKKYNTNKMVNRKGELIGSYDKTHATKDDLNIGCTAGARDESNIRPIETEFGPIGMLICYDVQEGLDKREHDLIHLYAERGAGLILVSTIGDYSMSLQKGGMAAGVWTAISGQDSYKDDDTYKSNITNPDGICVAGVAKEENGQRTWCSAVINLSPTPKGH